MTTTRLDVDITTTPLADAFSTYQVNLTLAANSVCNVVLEVDDGDLYSDRPVTLKHLEKDVAQCVSEGLRGGQALRIWVAPEELSSQDDHVTLRLSGESSRLVLEEVVMTHDTSFYVSITPQTVGAAYTIAC